jgi:alkanesulfonate monooxygenase SsuD/methylene tetrahydromethanopterin reductase-like flavin-dependent oxidoreductase (luciferase family)
LKLGLQIPSFTWPGGPEAIGPTLARIVRTADDVGFDSIWVMDHFFQIRGQGPATDPMLEGYPRSASSPRTPSEPGWG